MATHHPSTPSTARDIAVYAAGQRADLVLAGEIRIDALPELETALSTRPLSTASEWRIDMHDVTYLDLACAYALLRATTTRTDIPAVTIHGPRHTVERTLRHVGLGDRATISAT
ncbi:STAS domain-containing protein [Streptomyces sp. NPDC058685]|uniref:STAS domain-containing protein n=1 Tax=Streptomyces sp. NPDC058685 TaxID=3346598 RepID=UPI0036516970